MKKVLFMVVLLVIVGVGASYLSTGGLPFMQPQSEEEQELAALRSDLRAARQEYQQAGRAAGMSGLDTTAEAETALREIDRIAEELKDLEEKLSSDAAKTAARRLEDEIESFRQQVR